MKIIMILVGAGMLAACGGEKKAAPSASQNAAEMGRTAGMVDPAGPGPLNMDAPRPGPPPGGDPPGACRNVGVPQNSSCRLSSLRLQNCPDCPTDWLRYRSGHLVKVDGTDHGFESGAFRVPADRDAEFQAFMRKNSPVPCSGMIVHPPCNPAATHMELEITWPEWIQRERM